MSDTIRIEPTRMVVNFSDDDKPISQLKTAFDLRDVEVLYGPTKKNYYLFKTPNEKRGFEILKKLIADSQIEKIYFDSYGEFLVAPNDQYFSSQWNLSKIQMENTWEISKGNPNILIAIVDSGTDLDHDDLENVIWSGIGWDFENNDSNPEGTNYHGTAVAGIAGAQTNNSTIGVAGIAGRWDTNTGSRLMIYKVGTYSPSITFTWMAIEEATDEGATVITMSLAFAPGYPGLNELEEAVDYAETNGVVVIASAGNNGGNSSGDKSIRYSARFPNTIAVGAAVEDDSRWVRSNSLGSAIGSQLDIMAPGGEPIIWTTDIEGSSGATGGNYMKFSGTSASAPHIAGVAALMRSINSNLTPAQVGTILQNSADEVSGMNGQNFTNEYGYGRVNAYNALIYTIENHGAHLGTEMPQVRLPLYDDLTLQEDVTLASGSNLTIASESGTVTIAAASGTVTIGGPGGAAKIAGGGNSDNDDSGNDEATNERIDSETTPEQYALSNNYPNPFNPVTIIRYQLPISGYVTLKVFDMLGREVATLVNGQISAGRHEVPFDASSLSSGIYIYQIKANDFVETQKMTLIK